MEGIKFGSLEWAVDFLTSCVKELTRIELADEEGQKAAQKLGLTGFYEYHIKVLTKEICQGCYYSQDSEEYKKTHPEHTNDEED